MIGYWVFGSNAIIRKGGWNEFTSGFTSGRDARYKAEQYRWAQVLRKDDDDGLPVLIGTYSGRRWTLASDMAAYELWLSPRKVGDKLWDGVTWTTTCGPKGR